jgi:hypothetical protein
MRAHELYEAKAKPTNYKVYGDGEEAPAGKSVTKKFNGEVIPSVYANAETPEKFHKSGVKLFHGTYSKNLKSILKNGIRPKISQHTKNGQIEISQYFHRKGLPVPDSVWDEEPMSYWDNKHAKNGWTNLGDMVVSFTTNSSDVLGRSHNANGEWCVFNKISPDRLSFMHSDGTPIDVSHLKEDARIVRGVNTTCDVGENEIAIQAKKFGNTVSKDGVPTHPITYRPKGDR